MNRSSFALAVTAVCCFLASDTLAEPIAIGSNDSDELLGDFVSVEYGSQGLASLAIAAIVSGAATEMVGLQAQTALDMAAGAAEDGETLQILEVHQNPFDNGVPKILPETLLSGIDGSLVQAKRTSTVNFGSTSVSAELSNKNLTLNTVSATTANSTLRETTTVSMSIMVPRPEGSNDPTVTIDLDMSFPDFIAVVGGPVPNQDISFDVLFPNGEFWGFLAPRDVTGSQFGPVELRGLATLSDLTFAQGPGSHTAVNGIEYFYQQNEAITAITLPGSSMQVPFDEQIILNFTIIQSSNSFALVPEPSTFALGILGLLSLGFVGRRRRRRR